MKAWQNNASSNTTSTQRKLTTAKLIRKSPVPQDEEQGFLVSIILLFQGSFLQQGLQEHLQRLGQG